MTDTKEKREQKAIAGVLFGDALIDLYRQIRETPIDHTDPVSMVLELFEDGLPDDNANLALQRLLPQADQLTTLAIGFNVGVIAAARDKGE